LQMRQMFCLWTVRRIDESWRKIDCGTGILQEGF
jgi:hypothetical protein